MNEYLSLARADWSVAYPSMVTLLLLMAIDVVMGLMIAFSTKTLSSSTSRRGMMKKAATLLVIAATAALDPFVPNIALALVTTLFYLATEVLSIVENAGRLGIPIPQRLLDALHKLKEDTTVPEKTNGQETTNCP